jgi:hypothetical protein
VEPLTAEGYAASGVRLKSRGYLMRNEISAAAAQSEIGRSHDQKI